MKRKNKSGNKRFHDSDFITWGIHPVTETLRTAAQTIAEIHILKGKKQPKIQNIIDLAKQQNIRIKFAEHFSVINADNTECNHQGVVAKTMAVATVDEKTFLASLEEQTIPPLLLALDSIQDPHNLGAILRSAAAAGVTGVILPKDRSAPLGGTVRKTAAGALAHLQIILVTNLANFLQMLQHYNIWNYGTVKDNGQSIYETDLTGPVCIVIGNEEKGLRPLVARQCDFKITIPMQGSLDSLNASVAAGITLFETVRQRSEQNSQPLLTP
jgi:23S rRNA (guanosine2251-2'-O)-methyltransferase